MLCPSCGKRPAIEYARISEGKEIKLSLCPECYKRLYSENGDEEFLSSVLSSLGGEKKRKCPVCDTTLGEFKRTGILGCAYCYTAFREELAPTVYYIQGNVHHVGKTPSIDTEDNYAFMLKRDSLKGELEHALREGDYVRANEIKSEIMKLNRLIMQGEDVR